MMAGCVRQAKELSHVTSEQSKPRRGYGFKVFLESRIAIWFSCQITVQLAKQILGLQGLAILKETVKDKHVRSAARCSMLHPHAP